MAEGFLRSKYSNRYEAFSAGVEPTKIHPFAVKVMKELGIDIAHHRAKNIEEFRGKTFDYVVTVCNHAQEACPFFPGKHILHQGFDDPVIDTESADESMNMFRRVRDEIRVWIEETFG